MGFFSSFFDLGERATGLNPKRDIRNFSGQSAADAALEGARLQAGVGQQGIDLQRDIQNRLFDLSAPFQQLGAGQIGALTEALEPGQNPFFSAIQGQLSDGSALNRLAALDDPENQAAFIENNPFFDTLANQAQDRLFSNQAARGKLGSGDTASALQQQIVGLGNDLLARERSALAQSAGTQMQNLAAGAGLSSDLDARRFNQLLDVVGLGQNAAVLQGNAIQSTGNNITNLLGQIGNAQAAGGIGAANALGQGSQNMVALGGALASFFSDRRLKCNILPVGNYRQYPAYLYQYKGHGSWYIGVMAQDVERINPIAVSEVGGYKLVDYGAL